MNSAYLHLVTNHFPVIGIIVGLALLITSMFWKSTDLRKLILWYFVALGLVTLVTYLSGEPAEEFVEHLPGFSESAIEEHEEASIFGLIAVEILAGLSVLALFLPNLRLAQRSWFFPTMLVLSIWATTVIARIAYLGGQIRHTEFSTDGVVAPPEE